jgi:uptake hydrogenase large subunit
MLEGRLTIDLYRDGRGIDHVAIASSRPLSVASMFEKKSPEDVCRGLPLIFSVCAVAQGRAAVLAMTRSLDVAECARTEVARDCLVLTETAREHLLGIALRWSPYLGEKPEKQGLRQLTRLLPDMQRALFAEAPPFQLEMRASLDPDALNAAIERLEDEIAAALGVPAAVFLSQSSPDDMQRWSGESDGVAARLIGKVLRAGWSRVGQANVAFLPDLDLRVLADRLEAADSAAFIARPGWDGQPCETTALSRRCANPLVAALLQSHGTGLLTRLCARLVDLACLPGELRELSRTLLEAPASMAPWKAQRGSGMGIAKVDAARGLLVHSVHIDDGLVSRYRILAPTEWNFHPDGAAAQGLCSLDGTSDEAFNEQACLLIDAIDPCVGYEVRVH